MQILSWFNHYNVIPSLNDFNQRNASGEILKNVKAAFYHTVRVNGDEHCQALKITKKRPQKLYDYNCKTENRN